MKIGFAPASVSVGSKSQSISAVGSVGKGIVNTMVDGYSDLAKIHSYDGPGNSYKAIYYKSNTYFLKVDSLEIGDCIVEFKLPSSVVNRRLTYGNWPTTSPVS